MEKNLFFYTGVQRILAALPVWTSLSNFLSPKFLFVLPCPLFYRQNSCLSWPPGPPGVFKGPEGCLKWGAQVA